MLTCHLFSKEICSFIFLAQLESDQQTIKVDWSFSTYLTCGNIRVYEANVVLCLSLTLNYNLLLTIAHSVVCTWQNDQSNIGLFDFPFE